MIIEMLIEKNLITPGTMLTGKVLANSLGQHKRYIEKDVVVDSKDSFFFTCHDQFGVVYEMPIGHVRKIDGMPPARFAASFDLNISGLKLSNGKKRGRKTNKEKGIQ